MKREDLSLVTPEQFKDFGPCWLETREGRARFRRVAAQRAKWNALDVLDLADVDAFDRLWAVLRGEFLPKMLLHEFACRSAEWALSLVENPDARSIEAIQAKRRWMAGDATDGELGLARGSAMAAEEIGLGATAYYTARAARFAASAAAGVAARAAAQAVAWAAARASRRQEIGMLRELIDEWEN